MARQTIFERDSRRIPQVEYYRRRNSINLWLKVLFAAVIIISNLSICVIMFRAPYFLSVLFIVNGTLFSSWLIQRRIMFSARSEVRTINSLRDMDKQKLESEERESDILHTISFFTETFIETEKLEYVLKELASKVRDNFSADMAYLEIYGNDVGVVENHFSFPEKMPCLRETVREKVLGRPVLVNDVRHYEEFREFGSLGIVGMLIAPLRIKEQVLGMLALFTREEASFTATDLDLLSTFTTNASMLIESARLLEVNRVLSVTDELTGLYNLRYFNRKIQDEFARCKRYQRKLSLIAIDIDNFKHYNDTNGHPAGDQLLREIATIFKENTRPSDIISRNGGEEFSVILVETDSEGAESAAQKLCKEVEEYSFAYQESQPGGSVTISLGISSFPEDTESAESLIKLADIALYESKRNGKNRATLYKDMITKIIRR